MNTSAIFSLVPVGVSLVALFILVAAWLVYYALRNKRDVSAELSHGKTSFKLEASGRSSRRAKNRPFR
jgi:hypothetical protein